MSDQTDDAAFGLPDLDDVVPLYSRPKSQRGPQTKAEGLLAEVRGNVEGLLSSVASSRATTIAELSSLQQKCGELAAGKARAEEQLDKARQELARSQSAMAMHVNTGQIAMLVVSQLTRHLGWKLLDVNWPLDDEQVVVTFTFQDNWVLVVRPDGVALIEQIDNLRSATLELDRLGLTAEGWRTLRGCIAYSGMSSTERSTLPEQVQKQIFTDPAGLTADDRRLAQGQPESD